MMRATPDEQATLILFKANIYQLASFILSNTIDVTISIEVTNMIREAPAMTVRQNLGELLNEIIVTLC